MNPDFCSPNPLNSSNPPKKENPDRRLLELMTSFLKKQDIHPDILELHQQNLQKIRQIGVIAQAIDKKQFREPEFIFFLDLKAKFLQGTDEYRGLNHSLRLLRVALDAKNSFLRIEEVELMHRSGHQQDFYQLVFNLLSRNVSTQFFQKKVHEKLQEILPLIKTEKGRNALYCYVQELDNLAKQDKLGLRLLYLFKKYQLTDYSILRKVADMVSYVSRQDVKNLDYILSLVTTYYQLFENLGRIIGVPAVKSTPENYAIILQYLALRYKHQTNYFHFRKLITILQDWEQAYQVIQNIRRRHSPLKYHQPPEFQMKLAGEQVYQQYQHYLVQF